MRYRTDMQQTRGITTGAVARYMLLPGILPRLRNFGFALQRLVFVFVQILGAAGLIEKNHPCLRVENIGRYRFSDIVYLAWANVRFDKRHLPQAIMFFVVMASVLLVAGIIVTGALALFSQVGTAAEAYAQYFSIPNTGDTQVPYDARGDWAFQFLERIFGTDSQTGLRFWIQGDLPQGGNQWYTNIFIGMLATYSRALMAVAVFMILYLVIIALADSARSGEPFGEKFDSVWAPIRFAIALGLLLPISGSGYNGAQMLVFQASEWGSNLATNLWHRGIKSVQTNDEFIATTISDPGYRFVRDMFLINLCVYGYSVMLEHGEIKNLNGTIDFAEPVQTKDRIIYHFGNHNSEDFCGSVAVPIPKKVPKAYLGQSTAIPTKPGQPPQPSITRTEQNFLPTRLAKGYYDAASRFMPPVQTMMKEVATEFTKDVLCRKNQNYLELECKNGKCADQVKGWIYEYWRTALGREVNDPARDYFLADYQNELAAYNSWISDSLITDAKYGWASAGAFYLRMSYAISYLNEIIRDQPTVVSLPKNVYRFYATPKDNSISNRVVDAECKDATFQSSKCKRYEVASRLHDVLLAGANFFKQAPRIGQTEDELKDYLRLGGPMYDSALRMPDKEAAPVESLDTPLGPVWGTLFWFFEMDTADMNPLGQVISWGIGFINAAVISFGVALAASITGLFVAGAVMNALSDIAMTIGYALSMPGFVLVFVVPIMPFLYFTFAVMEWVISVIEAVIGMPLWVLTFISLEGGPVDKAMGGLKLLFDIILRPTIIVMSLLVAVLIFTAGAKFMSDAMHLYMNATIDNVDKQVNLFAAAAPGFGLLFMYVFGIYMLATSSFQLIDMIPNVYGRWIGIKGGIHSKMAFGGEMVKYAGVVGSQLAGKGAQLMTGTAVSAIGSYKSAKDARDLKNAHDQWHRNETERIRLANEQTKKFNDNLDAINDVLRAKGLDTLEKRKYEDIPKNLSYQYFKDQVTLGMAGDVTSPKRFTDTMPIAMAAGFAAGSDGGPDGSGRSGGKSKAGGDSGPHTHSHRYKPKRDIADEADPKGGKTKSSVDPNDKPFTPQERQLLRALRTRVKNAADNRPDGVAPTSKEQADIDELKRMEDRAAKWGESDI